MIQFETPTRERVHVGAFVDREQRQQLIEVARREDRSVSSVIRQALAEHVGHEHAAEEREAD